MKLADWARKQGIAYLTAYRWFRDGKLPVKAYQSDSGTIIVEDDDTSEPIMPNNLGMQNDDVMGLVLNKVVELSKNNATVTDLAVYILSNFSLKFKSTVDSPRYSKNKPKSEDIQKHFQQFIPKGEKPKPNMFVTKEEELDELVELDEHSSPLVNGLRKVNADLNCINDSLKKSAVSYTSVDKNSDLYKDLQMAVDSRAGVLTSSINSIVSGSTGSEGLGSSTLLTPQTQNYTSTGNPAFRRLSFSSVADAGVQLDNVIVEVSDSDYSEADITLPAANGATGAFKPTDKELELAKKTFKSVDSNSPRRRGRKPSKNLGKK